MRLPVFGFFSFRFTNNQVSDSQNSGVPHLVSIVVRNQMAASTSLEGDAAAARGFRVRHLLCSVRTFRPVSQLEHYEPF
jgi:hypothetical protein